MKDESDDTKTTAGDDRTRVDSPETQGGSDKTRVDSTPTPPPASSQSSRSSDPSISIIPENLLEDRLLSSMPRTELNGRSVPTIGGIPLLSKLGQGGMGAVYLGYKTRLRQLVAVKVLPLHLAQLQPDMVSRFLREAQIAASIESPHLVRVSDVDEEEGLSYIVMEYVTGVSAGAYLKQLIRSGQKGMPEAEALDVCIAATTGLAVAHEAGVVHRDVKPDNILIPRARDGAGLRFRDSKISDLGLARSEELGQTITGSQSGMGTPGYMAPEQAMSARTAGKAADVFSMGATLYALLGGKSPFAGDSSTAVILATIQQPHMPIREKRPDVSEGTAKLIDLCLEKGPERRFADAAALLDALRLCREALSGNQTSAETTRVLTELQLTEERGEKKMSSSPTLRELPDETLQQTAPRLEAAAAKPPTGGRNARSPWPLAMIAVVVAMVILGIVLGRKLREGASSPAGLMPDATTGRVQLPIAYSGEKARFLPWAVQEFNKTAQGKNVSVELLPMSQVQAEEALMRGNPKIVVWTPTSSLLRPQFEERWRTKHDSSPILSDSLLSLTPQVFVMYKSRYEALRKKFGELCFASLRKALDAKTWER
ncbi:MAG TPA: serine/threonine-protein kinase, partial [Thermoanaerobaculia bacterium]|nr:serine/threonine-protein kinase [Thermoanaerobaculia bacterium]